jgi:hypothetical protein
VHCNSEYLLWAESGHLVDYDRSGYKAATRGKCGHFLASVFNLEQIWLHERKRLRDSRGPVE